MGTRGNYLKRQRLQPSVLKNPTTGTKRTTQQATQKNQLTVTVNDCLQQIKEQYY